jgi:exonuclease VII small subunit
MSTTTKSASYKTAYMKLEALSKEVESMDLSDLDKLVKVTEKAAGYAKICRERIRIIREKLESIDDAQVGN